jgi:hypothetical protein
MASQQKGMGSQHSSLANVVGRILATGDRAEAGADVAFAEAKTHHEKATQFATSAHIKRKEAVDYERAANLELAAAQRSYQEGLKLEGNAVRIDENLLENLAQQYNFLRQGAHFRREMAASAQGTAAALVVQATEIRVQAALQNNPTFQKAMIEEANRRQQQAIECTQEALKFTHQAAAWDRICNEIAPQLIAVRQRVQSLRAKAAGHGGNSQKAAGHGGNSKI